MALKMKILLPFVLAFMCGAKEVSLDNDEDNETNASIPVTVQPTPAPTAPQKKTISFNLGLDVGDANVSELCADSKFETGLKGVAVDLTGVPASDVSVTCSAGAARRLSSSFRRLATANIAYDVMVPADEVADKTSAIERVTTSSDATAQLTAILMAELAAVGSDLNVTVISVGDVTGSTPTPAPTRPTDEDDVASSAHGFRAPIAVSALLAAVCF